MPPPPLPDGTTPATPAARAPVIPATATPNSAALEADYRAAIADLTFNSKPIINTLTMVAQENQHQAPVIVRVVEEHIARSPAERKLPAFYLIDSILKNVGGSYREHFAFRMVPTFTNMYRAVSDETKYHMERVLRTWQELFPRSVISSLEQLVRDHHASFRRDGGTSTRRHPATTTGALTAQQQQQQQRAAADQALQRRVLDELMALIDYKQRLVILNPQDANVARETNALVQLRKLVASGALDATKMQQIGQQIAAMWPRDLPRPNQRQNMTPAQQQPQRQEQLQTPSAVPSNLSDILMQLRDISPLPATSHTRLPMISLLPQDIEARHPHAEEHLYKHLALQCNQCGFRFIKSTEGQRKMDTHMDWHFRQNRKQTAAEQSGKAYSRDWFLGEEEWLEMLEDVDTTSKQGPIFMQEEAARVDEAMRKKQRQEAIARTVLSMEEAGASQSAGTAVTCAICQEAFDSFFDEEAEEWMFRNAVKAPESGRVVHATCLVEASAEPVLSPVEGGKRGREGDASDGEKGREKGDVEPPSSKQRRKVK